ncbi:MAG: aminofutalosine synthase MqnE [Thermoanaerobacterales bacterium]|nr:aminofutalosine synthase MqnE [Thermoanaerobacterales bacterium]
MESLFADGELRDIVEKVLGGERLDRGDGIRLLHSKDLLTVGYLADLVRRRKHGDRVYFIVNRHINQTNICVNRCRFCAFSKDPGAPGSYALTLDEIVERARRSWALGISEVHIVGGLHPDLDLQYYLEMMRLLRQALPGVVIQALTAVEVEYLAQRHQMAVEDVLLALHQAGLDSLPGGGAEVFSPRVRELLCPKKISGERWLYVHEAAHRLGIRTNATMLYGHVETPEERVDHLLALRALQDRTGGFLTFIPLAFHRRHTELEGVVRDRTTGYDDLKMLAVSRLMLDNFDHIKAYWIMIGEKMSQVALSFGVDDFDGTVVEERITHAAGAETAQSATRRELVRQIRAAGRRPVERDTLYNVIREEF